MNRPLVSVVVLNWNGREFLGPCFESLSRVDYENYEVLLVDNASSDGSVEFTCERFPWVQIVQNEANVGFAEGNNRGYLRSRGDYVYFLNNDTWVDPHFLTALVEVMEADPTIGACQSKIYVRDTHCLDNVGDYLTRAGVLYHLGFLQEDRGQYDRRMDIFAAKGAAMIFRRKTLQAIGAFDPEFFIYFEETDLCWRAWLSGYRVVYVPTSVVHHTLGGALPRMTSQRVVYGSFKNRITSLLVNLGPAHLALILPLHLGLCILAALGFLLRGRVATGFWIVSALLQSLRHLPRTLHKRRIVQTTIRKVPDRTLMPIILKKVGLRYYWHLFTGTLERYEEGH